MSRPDVTPFFDAATNSWTYLVADPDTGDAVIIDAVLDYDPRSARVSHAGLAALLDQVEQRQLHLRWVLETHAHADHLAGGHWLRDRTGAPLVIGSHITDVQREFAPRFGLDDLATDGSQFDVLVDDGATLPLGRLTIRVMHTPGHTPACLTYVIGDAAFVGDTLFMPDYGTARCDFPGGDAATLHASIQTILALPPETRIFLGHDYLPAGRSEYACETSVAAQKAGNVHVHDGIDAASFIAMRRARDATLAPPALILPSLQVNIAAGELPPPDAQGRRFLRLPLTLAG
ncbi:MBL fold metallo-hydrolase [Sandarakinorhabdus cyanobacteriorum]|uniref:MBL fold metallo-hydrolase n=1 Tax=Sandarakinorhabdus cyanobacteriorum TaxID=1981098 RepID=A0A255YN64_9SPHN|nr:MBL fold metallo-hydrolase [Sandarakinorhabdus cyanobacteriorum]OYQ30025.1 MBL fold metallo-hydrolase [Sandarakinorhabdus cyanobacteriorum]